VEHSNNKPLAGKVAVVTGSGRGLGRAEAMALAEAGARLVINDVGGAVSGEGYEKSVAQTVADEIRAAGGEAVANSDNIATMAGGKALVEAAMDAYGRLDILVNNAGIARPRTIDEMSEEEWDTVVAVHLKGQFTTIRHAAPVFRAQKGGVIVNTASQSGLGHYGMANYSAAKEGVVGLTRTVARDLGHYGVRCNAIRPLGITRMATPEIMETIRISQEELGFAATGSLWVKPSNEFPTPEQVGVFVTWLCTDSAANVNGRTFFVSGGTVGLYPEPELCRSAYRSGGWSLETLDAAARDYLVGDLSNLYAGRKA
jgi:NAD(P)-dependent dehydrogenase (short-subunit alcohol dehydrogenase family)